MASSRRRYCRADLFSFLRGCILLIINTAAQNFRDNCIVTYNSQDRRNQIKFMSIKSFFLRDSEDNRLRGLKDGQ